MLYLTLVFFPVACAFAAYIAGRRHEGFRDIFVIAAAFAELAFSLLLLKGPADLALRGFLADGLSFTADGFRQVYGIVTAFMWAGTTLFAREYFAHEREHLNRYWFFVLVTLGATEGVMLSGDLMTAFIFFEILSFTSFTWVIHEETAGAIRAGYTYLFIAVIGGLVLFMGLVLVQTACGTLSFAALPAAASAAKAAGKGGQILAGGVCILLGFGAKAGMFPVHVWLPKAHPVAPSPASALLSGILTKVGVYGILMTTLQMLAAVRPYGVLVLILGVITMALGALLALFSVNLKRTLACSSMSQIGFILTGVAMSVLLQAAGEEEGVVLALSGAMLHMVNHSLIKLTLFMAAGVVVMNLHELTLDRIRGWGRNKPFLKAAFALGALGISGVPLFNGYISKTMLHEGIVEGIHACEGLSGMLGVIEWVFLISGGFTFAYMLKLFICVFVEKNRDEARQRAFDADASCMNPASTIAVFGSSLLMFILGQPFVMTRLAAFMTGYEEILEFRAFSLTNLKGGAISLMIGALVYLVIVRHVLMRKGSYVNLWPARLDLEDLVYRPLLTRYLPGLFGTVISVFGENRVLRPLCARIPAGAGGAASLFGENHILTPFAGLVTKAASIISLILADGMDAMIVLLRASVVREKAVAGRRSPGRRRSWRLLQDTQEAAQPIVSGFTFALMMTCIGILVVLLAMIAYILLG